jgi:DeoR/GlpR family transcriptional regulator of sugar metabolism
MPTGLSGALASTRAGTTGVRERRARILRILDVQEYVDVAQLAELYSLSEASIRRDLAMLEQDGLLTRVRGGAVVRRGNVNTGYVPAAKRTRLSAKKRIGQLAATLIEDHSVVFFYSGTTVAQVAASLPRAMRRSITIVTNSEIVISEVATWDNSHLVAVGGLFLPEYMTFVGPQAHDALSHLSADVAVVGCDGLSASGGLTTPHQLVAEMGAAMADRARTVVAVADSSKIGRRGFTQIVPISAIDMFVTDSEADDAECDAIRAEGVEVLIA